MSFCMWIEVKVTWSRKIADNPNGIAPSSPGLASQRLPWINVFKGFINPNGVVAVYVRIFTSIPFGVTPLGLRARFGRLPRVDTDAPTLGWRTKSRWDLL